MNPDGHPADADLRDARIIDARIEEEGRVILRLRLPDGARKLLRFEGVRSLPVVEQSLKLAKRHGGATILDWKPAAPGNTFIYLLDGVVSVWAERLMLE